MLSGGLTVSGEHVYVGTERGTLIALNANDGEIAWTANAGGEVLSRPEVSDGLVLVHTGNGLLQAFDTASGEQRWSLNLDTPSLSVRGESAPAVAMGQHLSVATTVVSVRLCLARVRLSGSSVFPRQPVPPKSAV